MKKNYIAKGGLIVIALLQTMALWAQTTVTMPLGGPAPAAVINPPGTCFFNFYDSGGPLASYNNGADASVTFYPSNPATHRIQINFAFLALEAGFDALYIYNSATVGLNQVQGPQGATTSGFPAGNWQTINPGFVTANTGLAAVGANPDEALTIRFRSDLSVIAPGWSAIVSQVPKVSCTLTAPASIADAPVGPGGCTANVLTALPLIGPGGCNAALTLQYRINGAAPVAVPAPLPPSIILPNLPKGTNVVVWQLVDPCGGGVVSAATQTIVVADHILPAIACPGNITFNLDPGECTKGYTYAVTASDNCPFAPSGQVSHPIDFDNGNAGIMFDVINLSAAPLTLSQFAPSLNPGTWNMEVYVTAAASTWQGHQNNPGDWNLAGIQTVTSTATSPGTPVSGFNIVLAPGQSRGIYLTSTTGTPLNYTGINAGVNRQFDDGVLRVSSAPGAGKGYPFAATFISRAYNGSVSYAVNGANGVTLLSGLPSGAEFPIGITTNIYQSTDLSGNTATCSFTVTVLGFPNASATLACNDLITVALGPDCMASINADQILEGGPYGCYDNYLVQIDKVPPFNNGPWVPAQVGAADIGKTYGVKVTDPATGNFCLSVLVVEDNLPPVLVCTDLELPCNFNTTPAFVGNVPSSRSFQAAGLPRTVQDFQTVELLIPVQAPADASINDLDLALRINGDAFNFNLKIELQSPSGTVVPVWDQAGGCASSPLFVRFDDEASGGNNCLDFIDGDRAPVPFSPNALAGFDGEPAAGIWRLRIADVNGFADLSTVVSSEIIINYSATYSAGFPNGLQYPGDMTQISPTAFVVPGPLLDGCSDVTLSYSDQTVPQSCASGLTGILNRTWTARDASGNVASCVQEIRLVRPTLDDVTMPPNYDDIDQPGFACGSAYPTPIALEALGLQGYPHVFGMPFGCSINWTYEDLLITICDGTYTIGRHWSAIDFCTSQTWETTQVIKVRDVVAPTFACPADLTVSTDLYQCCATVNLPDVIVTDGCSRINNVRATITATDFYSGAVIGVYNVNGTVAGFPGNNPGLPDTLGVLPNTPCLPIGNHTVVYTVEDACGNTSSCSFQLAVRDFTPPVAVCDEFTVVAIGSDDPNDCYEPSADGCQFAGTTLVAAQTFDDGSYDNCGFIRFRVRRMAPYSDCILGLNGENGAPPCQDGFPDFVSEYDRATSEGDSIKFYCCEVGTTQMVILRVYQLDALGNPSIGPDGGPVYNECLVQVEVQDKLKPGCQSPANLTVSCENFDPSLWAYGVPQVEDNCCLDSSKVYMGQKGLTHSVSYNQFDTVCNRGTIVRTFRVYDCHGFSSQCTQRIVVNYEQDFLVKFPDDVIVTFCDSSGVYGAPQFFGEDCELLGVSYQDEIYTVVPDACYKIERTWHVINWCNYDPNGSCIAVPNPNPNATLNHPANLPGPTVSPLGTPAPWSPTSVKIKSTDPSPTNYSIFWQANANCYEYKQIIKIVDGQAPVVENCPAGPVDFCDGSENDPLLWNDPEWYDNILFTNDLCEGAADLTVTADDACSGANLTVRYLLFLDLDNDADMETVVSSTNPPAAGTIHFNNATTPNFQGGEVLPFDHRPVANDQKYRFAVETVTANGKKIGRVRWNTPAQPNAFSIPQLPYGTHKIKWIVEDGCGNEKVCEYNFTVRDCKPPTVVCFLGLTVNMMPGGMINMFTTDLLQFGFDNCTPPQQLRYAIRKSGTGAGFPVDNAGHPLTSVSFDCDDLGTNPVELWAMDAVGNADFCEAYVIVQDNSDHCNPNVMVSVAGALKNETGAGVEEADVAMEGTYPAGPSLTLLDKTGTDGDYMFQNAVPIFANYTVTPVKEDNPLNGVTTYDLVLISRHILGLEPLPNPYRIIAADANKSGSVTTFDIVELRKLILGMYQVLPNNNSWRFIDNGFGFPNPDNPFQTPFPENKTAASIQASQMADDFVAVKVGDVNGTAVANSLVSTDDRSAGLLLFEVEDRLLQAGEIAEVEFRTAEPVAGYQFTLNLDALEVLEVQPGPGQSDDNFAVFPDQHALTTSWDAAGATGTGTFRLRLRARSAGRLSEMIGLSGRITRAEAYRGAAGGTGFSAEKLDVGLRFHDQGATTISGVGFELYQNQPNPFREKTTIGFHLPEAAEATLTVFDAAGRTVFTRTAQFPQGYSALPVDLKSSPSSGSWFYRLQTAQNSATRSMIQTH